MLSLYSKCILLVCFVSCAFAAVSEENMRQSALLVRNVCQPKFKISDEVADGIKAGNIPDQKDAKCYIHCVVENMSMMKKNKVNYDAAMKQFDTLLPDNMKEPYKQALTTCKDSANGEKNACEVAYKLINCFRANNPMFTFV